MPTTSIVAPIATALASIQTVIEKETIEAANLKDQAVAIRSSANKMKQIDTGSSAEARAAIDEAVAGVETQAKAAEAAYQSKLAEIQAWTDTKAALSAISTWSQTVGVQGIQGI